MAHVGKEQDGLIIEGILQCTNRLCQREYPIIDGIPIIVADLRKTISDNILQIINREDLGEITESILGDCCAPNSAFDSTRNLLSIYAWSHYHDKDTEQTSNTRTSGSIVDILHQTRGVINDLKGPVLDLGSSVGRTTFELASTTDELVLGIDLNFSMLKLAMNILRNGKVKYPLKSSGMVYHPKEFNVDFEKSDNIDFWLCDALDLPFKSNQFGLVTSYNLLDCVNSPMNLLQNIKNQVNDRGHAIITSPYDWSLAAGPVESWLGGHSQRGEARGNSSTILREILSDEDHPQSIAGFPC